MDTHVGILVALVVRGRAFTLAVLVDHVRHTLSMVFETAIVIVLAPFVTHAVAVALLLGNGQGGSRSCWNELRFRRRRS
jgi:hypothetical protein